MFYICTRNRKDCMGIGPWCNGNTPVFGTVIQGSSPCGPTKNSDRNIGVFLLLLFRSYILKVITGRLAWLTKSSLILPLKKCAIPFLP